MQVLSNKKTILLERDEQKTLENTLQTVSFANEKKPKLSNIHYK